MKSLLGKILSVFLLTILLTGNVFSLHIYFHGQEDLEINHSENHLTDHNGCDNEEEAPCEICFIAFNLNNLDYNNTHTFAFESLTQIQQAPNKKALSFVEILQKRLYLNKNRNKAPPYIV